MQMHVAVTTPGACLYVLWIICYVIHWQVHTELTVTRGSQVYSAVGAEQRALCGRAHCSINHGWKASQISDQPQLRHHATLASKTRMTFYSPCMPKENAEMKLPM